VGQPILAAAGFQPAFLFVAQATCICNLLKATRLPLFNGNPASEPGSQHNPVTGCITMKTIHKLPKRFFPYSTI
jgi:hypothetical protein